MEVFSDGLPSFCSSIAHFSSSLSCLLPNCNHQASGFSSAELQPCTALFQSVLVSLLMSEFVCCLSPPPPCPLVCSDHHCAGVTSSWTDSSGWDRQVRSTCSASPQLRLSAVTGLCSSDRIWVMAAGQLGLVELIKQKYLLCHTTAVTATAC